MCLDYIPFSLKETTDSLISKLELDIVNNNAA